MSTKHTRGPWTVLPEEVDRDYIRVRGTRLGERYKVANVLTPTGEGVPAREADETRANARLIANAPRMLEACEFMLAHAFERKWQGDERAYDMLHAILRGIKGDGNG